MMLQRKKRRKSRIRAVFLLAALTLGCFRGAGLPDLNLPGGAVTAWAENEWRAADAVYRDDTETGFLSPKAKTEKKKTTTVYAGGMPFGVRLYTKGVMVVGLNQVDGQERSPAYEGGVRTGDLILSINEVPTTRISDVTDAVEHSDGKPLSFVVQRQEQELTLRITPVKSKEDGRYKAGLWVKDSTAGIGTVTFIYEESGVFGGLGHGICDGSTGLLMPMTRGTVLSVAIGGAVRGQPGVPGELKGCFLAEKTGTLLANTERGVFGVFGKIPESTMQPIPLGTKQDIKEGEATILTTVGADGVKPYQVMLSNLRLGGAPDKNFVVTVTDPALLQATGGIVQGMSGSPVIQNGRLVGAVTHVMVSDPTRGYGILIENMLSEMPETLS